MPAVSFTNESHGWLRHGERQHHSQTTLNQSLTDIRWRDFLRHKVVDFSMDARGKFVDRLLSTPVFRFRFLVRSRPPQRFELRRELRYPIRINLCGPKNVCVSRRWSCRLLREPERASERRHHQAY